MLLHPREGHVELVGTDRARSVCTPELLQNAAPGGVRERGERGIEAGLILLNHLVQLYARIGGMQEPPKKTVTYILKKAGTVEYYCRFIPT